MSILSTLYCPVQVSPEIFQDSLLARRILREIKLLAHFDHENIIGLRNILMPHNEEFDMVCPTPNGNGMGTSIAWKHSNPIPYYMAPEGPDKGP